MASNGIKTEDGVSIKRDPELYEDEEDKYVDGDEDGELQIQDPPRDVWLAKLPKWLWEAWSQVADDEEFEIGKLRVYDEKHGSKVKLVLHDLPGGQHASVPKKYDITVNRSSYNNTVVFSEKDQPGFKSWRPNRVFRKEDRQANRDEAHRINKNKRYSSAIPKQVSLAGQVLNEVTVTAVENEEYRRLTDARFKAMFAPKRQTNFATGVDRSMHPSIIASNRFSAFTTAAAHGKPVKKKQTEKAVRISQEDLLDNLNQCFKEFRYWSLRALKQRLHQPEAYIKSVVEKIATLIRQGPFTMQYRLNPEYERSLGTDLQPVKEEAAVEEDFDEDDESEGEGDDFEDVKMDDA
ncbi:hypothetical protein AAFC00_006152 [Neodothiora populina]|uniref:Transcription initiation factor IIF subunit beta n=1 Tax=Neodothiora populina TaxID=2781224 RepID=A0ABR3P5M6_9PEZI